MAVDHTRAMPVAPERVEHIAQMLYDRGIRELTAAESVTVLQLAMQEAQVDALNDVRFFLNEAYDIYNARFR